MSLRDVRRKEKERSKKSEVVGICSLMLVSLTSASEERPVVSGLNCNVNKI